MGEEDNLWALVISEQLSFSPMQELDTKDMNY